MSSREAIGEITAALRRRYPNATYALDWKDPWQLLVGTVLAAQSSDALVNKITPPLFEKYPDVKAFSRARIEDLGEEIRACGMGLQKAKALIECAQQILERFEGKVPRTMADMLTLPRVQRKTANVVLNTAFAAGEGIVVDLHVARVAPRLGLTGEEKPEKIEADLMRLVPREDWAWWGSALILHGRETCRAKDPRCTECVLEKWCEKVGVQENPSPGASAGTSTKPKAPPRAGETKMDQGMALPSSWQTQIGGELSKPYFSELQQFVRSERQAGEVFPPEKDVFTAFELTPFDKVTVVLLGQDPYHDDGQAHGLCFSVRKGIKPPPSLANMFKELETDLGIPRPDHGCLEAWAKQGVLLLNAVLTVRAHTPNSHKDRGWETFTDAVIRAVNDRQKPAVFALWGAYAQKKAKAVDPRKHRVLSAAHPSPLSAKKFLGSKPFSAINDALTELGAKPIDWHLP